MTKQDWHTADIIAAVKKKTGSSLTKLAIANELNEQACIQALHRPYSAPEAAIAKAIGVPAYLIWPSRYRENGQRKHRLHVKSVSKLLNKDTEITHNTDTKTNDK